MKQLQSVFGRVHGALCERESGWYFPDLFAALFAAFFTVAAVTMQAIPYEHTAAEFLPAVPLLWFSVAVVGVTVLLAVLQRLLGAARVLPWALTLSVTAFCLCLPFKSVLNVWLACGMALLCWIVCRWMYTRYDTPFSGIKFTYKVTWIITAVLFLLFTVIMSLMGVVRYYAFSYDTFDFGIFAQMFAYMKATGLPYTTVERGQLLSHFAVHFSPFFYLLLPGYLLFSSPAYLCVIQTVFVGAGVFAVCGIAKELGFSPKMAAVLSALYLAYPSLSLGLYYDFHENKFLTFCVLFALYFLLKRRWVPFYVFAVLLCSVKEDAAFYLAAIALYMLFHERLVRHGLCTFGLAVGYFAFAVMMTGVCGASGGMEFGYRYSNFAVNGEVSIGGLVQSVVFNFGYALSEMFQQGKVEFLLWMFLPVMFLPFFNKKISVLLLFVPMVLVNLLSNWPYQHDVGYQYTYGVAALILFAAIVTLRTLKPPARKALVTAGLMLSIAVTVPYVSARHGGYLRDFAARHETYAAARELLRDTLPKDSTIGVEGDVTTILYDYPHLVLDPRTDEQTAAIEYYAAKMEDGDVVKLVDKGFELVAKDEFVVILKNPAYQK